MEKCKLEKQLSLTALDCPGKKKERDDKALTSNNKITGQKK